MCMFLDFALMFVFQDFLQTFLEKFRHLSLVFMSIQATPTRRSSSDCSPCMEPSILRCFHAWNIWNVELASVLDNHKHQDQPLSQQCQDSLVIVFRSIAFGSESCLATITVCLVWSTWPLAFNKQFVWMTMDQRLSMRLCGGLGCHPMDIL